MATFQPEGTEIRSTHQLRVLVVAMPQFTSMRFTIQWITAAESSWWLSMRSAPASEIFGTRQMKLFYNAIKC